MDLTNLLWIFLILSSLHPVVRQKMLEAAGVRLLREFEARRGKVTLLVPHVAMSGGTLIAMSAPRRETSLRPPLTTGS